MVDRSADIDTSETAEWLEALDSVLRTEGPERAHYLIERLIDKARRSGAHLPYSATTAYVNTIHPDEEPRMPGEPGLEHRIRSIIRWNAMAMIAAARESPATRELGGHISTFGSSANALRGRHEPLLQARRRTTSGPSDSGLLSRGTVRRACTPAPSWKAASPSDDLDTVSARRSNRAEPGLSSYPHPRLMPDYWEHPTVSMGLGPLIGDLSGSAS